MPRQSSSGGLGVECLLHKRHDSASVDEILLGVFIYSVIWFQSNVPISSQRMIIKLFMISFKLFSLFLTMFKHVFTGQTTQHKIITKIMHDIILVQLKNEANISTRYHEVMEVIDFGQTRFDG